MGWTVREINRLQTGQASRELMNGEMVSGSSGATAPSSFQFFVRPLLTEFACMVEVVRL